MKQKKKWMIPLCVVGGLLLISAGLFWYMVSHSMAFSVGRCLVADNSSYMFIDGNSPVVMSNRKDEDGMFAGLETGDKILLLHSGIETSYPGRTGVYWCMKLANGSQADIPEQVVEELTKLGWVSIANEADPNAGTPAPEAYAFDAQYIRTNGGPEEGYPYHTVISSRAELEAYYESHKDIYDLGRRETVYSDSTIGFLDACDKYDDAYFERQNLVLIVLQEGSGSIRHEITDVRRNMENGLFHLTGTDGATVECDFMHKGGSNNYYWADQFGAVSLSLEGSGKMWFLLPDEGVSMDEFLADEQTMEFLNSNGNWENSKHLIVNMSVPKFDVVSDLDLREGLRDLGVTDVFDATVANFSPMTSEVAEIFLSKADHAARVTIDEEGVTAAAYTVMMAAGAAAPPEEEMDFVLDRPFLFAITGYDGLPLFVGVVNTLTCAQ